MNYTKNSELKNMIKMVLAEDIGEGDITTKLLFPRERKVHAVIVAGEKGIICGVNIVRLVFKLWDNKVRVVPCVQDGDRVGKGQILVKIHGKASSILSSERVALNFLGLLSGISTRTNQFVKRVRNYKVRIMDTRKTLPGLRELEKYAVKIGGGDNHRVRLDEMVLIKENHLIASYIVKHIRSVKKIVNTIKQMKPKYAKLEIEVRNLREFKDALRAKPDIIMLDNMKINDIKKAVTIISKDAQGYLQRKTLLEASGNINLKNICAYARTGVDIISLGTITKDVHSLDLSLEINKGGGR